MSNNGGYYEAVSDDDDTLEDQRESQQFMFENNRVSHTSDSPSLDFEELPFVPKFSSEIRNTVEAAKNSENDCLETPLVGDWGSNSSTSITNIRNSSTPLTCPYFPSQSDPPVTVSNSNNDNHEISSKSQAASAAETNSSMSLSSPGSSVTVVNPSNQVNLGSVNNTLSTCSGKAGENVLNVINATSTSSWADENGDPIQGAFDNIDSCLASESCVNVVNNTKVEYVFHVKEKKNDLAAESYNSDVGSVSERISHGTVLSSLANLASNSVFTLDETKTINSDIQDAAGCETAEDYDQKKLYEASKNKKELCNDSSNVNSQDENNTSATGSGSYKDVLSKKKTEHVFKRNNFIDQKKSEDVAEDLDGINTTTNEAVKSNEDKVLESQALNELLKEVKQGAERARSYGALGWQKQPIPVVNKRFLQNTLVSTLREPYKPPGRRQFHTGLNKDRDQDRDNSSSSSDSRSSRSSSSRSTSSIGSCSRGSRSKSRDKKHHQHGPGRRGNYQGPWPGGPPNAYYDWAAMGQMGQYGGYPWYDPESLAMYYGTDGYPEMYYNDPQFWAAYRDFYGIGFNPGFRGRGQRGRGWRGRGRGGRGDDERYSDGNLSRSRSRSPVSERRSRRSRSRDSSPGSSTGKRSGSLVRSRRSRNGSGESGSKNRSRDSSRTKGEKDKSKWRQKTEDEESEHSKNRSKGSKSRSNSQISDKASKEPDKKDKKKKKKKKHKKSKNEDKEEDDMKMGQSSGRDDDGKSGDYNESETSHVRKVMKGKLAKDDSDPSKSVVKKKKKTGVKKAGDGEKKGKKKKSGYGLKGKKTKAVKDAEGIKSSNNSDDIHKTEGQNSKTETDASGCVMSVDTKRGDRKSGKEKADDCEKREECKRIKSNPEGDLKSRENEGGKSSSSKVGRDQGKGEVEKIEKDVTYRKERGGKEDARSERKESDVTDSKESKKKKSDRVDEAKRCRTDFETVDERRSRGGKEFSTERRSEKDYDANRDSKSKTKYEDRREEKTYERSSSQGDGEKGKGLGKLEEIERRLKERKAKRALELEQDLIRKEDRTRSERLKEEDSMGKVSIGSTTDKNKNPNDDSGRKDPTGDYESGNGQKESSYKSSSDLKDGGKKTKKVVKKKVKSQKNIDSGVNDKSIPPRDDSEELNSKKGKGNVVKKKKKVKRKIDDGDEQEIGTQIKKKKKPTDRESVASGKDRFQERVTSETKVVDHEVNTDKSLEKPHACDRVQTTDRTIVGEKQS